MRIAMVGTKGIPAKWGGIEKYVEEIGKRLVQRGHEVTVFASKWYCDGYKENYYEGMRIFRVPAFHFRATDALTNALFSFLTVSVRPFDVVHCHGYASYYFVPLAKSVGKKVIITAHGIESGWENPKYGAVARGIIRKAFRGGIRHADCVTTVAFHLQRRIIEQFGVNPLVTVSGVDKQTVLPPHLIKAKHGLNGGDYLLFLGRIDPIKRVDWLTDLRLSLNNRHKIVIAGGAQDSASTEYLYRLKAKCADNPRYIFTGPVSGQEKDELLSNCVALLSPSKNEGLPVSLLEALSMGKCCIASDIAGHREVIEDGISGFLFDQNDKDAFLAKVNYVLDLPKEETRRIGQTAEGIVSDGYSWEKTTALFEKEYMSMLGSVKASRVR